jgi:hypothetical protein
MASVAVLSRTDLSVAPGDETTLQVTVRNTGVVVDEFTIDPLGDAAGWIAVEPAVQPLFPGAEGVFTVTVRPPRSATTAPGPVSFGLRVRSTEDPDGTVVEEGVIDVARFGDTAVELLPRTSRARGRRQGRHELAIDNRGNCPLTCTFSALETDEKVAVEVGVLSVHVPAGEAAFVPVRVRATKSFLRGPAISHPFQVYVEPGNDPHVGVEGMFLQESILPKWFFKALARLLGGCCSCSPLCGSRCLKPTIEDTATAAAEKKARRSPPRRREGRRGAAAKAAAPVAEKQAAQQQQIDALVGGASRAAHAPTGQHRPARQPRSASGSPTDLPPRGRTPSTAQRLQPDGPDVPEPRG